MAFARGKHAWGISDRSGFRYRLRDMKKEWNGMLVGPDEYEPKHPQIDPVRPGADAIALKDPRPDRNEPLKVYVGKPTVEGPTLERPRAVAKVGSVEVTTT